MTKNYWVGDVMTKAVQQWMTNRTSSGNNNRRSSPFRHSERTGGSERSGYGPWLLRGLSIYCLNSVIDLSCSDSNGAHLAGEGHEQKVTSFEIEEEGVANVNVEVLQRGAGYMSLGLERKAGANKAGANRAGTRADWNPSSLEFNQTGAHVVWNSSSTEKVFVARVRDALSGRISTRQNLDVVRARAWPDLNQVGIDEGRTQVWFTRVRWKSLYLTFPPESFP
ncbi:hypothetical protein B0O80DRAFT_484361 [Mortierella sp. GBAus27b]|nr:hypothetical protein B0O80DRAFT_484361 [Mortierella sp. GBAus27b]